MNALIDKYLSAKGLDNAMEIAKILIQNDYQVMVQLDDCDVYIIAFEPNDAALGCNRFASLSQEEVEEIDRLRHNRNLRIRDLSRNEVQGIVDDWLITEDDDAYIDQSGDTIGKVKP